MTAALFAHQVIDTSSRVVSGASVRFMQGFRPGPVFHDPEMRTPAANPIRTNAAGRITVYLIAGQTYEITVEAPDGTRQQFVHVARADGDVIRETVTETIEVPVDRVVERVVTVDNPGQAKRIAELEAMLAAKAEPPPDLADLILLAETPAQTHDRLMRLFADAKQGAELARQYGGSFDGRSTVEWERKAGRYESGIDWNRGRMAEQI